VAALVLAERKGGKEGGAVCLRACEEEAEALLWLWRGCAGGDGGEGREVAGMAVVCMRQMSAGVALEGCCRMKKWRARCKDSLMRRQP
jgi:hypothetical protein